MFPIVANSYHFVIGIDTHARKHVAVLVNNLGAVVGNHEIRVTIPQMERFIDWALKRTGESVLFAIEGTSSYGETLTKLLTDRHLDVVEVKPPKTKSRGGAGKTDHIDAELAARSILHLPVDQLIVPRFGDSRKSLRILLGARRQLVNRRTVDKNALTALLRGEALGIDARGTLRPRDYIAISLWRESTDSMTARGIIKSEAKRLAKDVLALDKLLAANKETLARIVHGMAPSLLSEPGVGPITLGQILCAYSHKGRIRSAEAFASLAGTAPIPASSGNTSHYRLNHYGDRQLNHALNTIVLARMRTDEETKGYVEKRTKEGMSTRDIRRSLKRYVARSMFKQLEACAITA